MLNIMIFFPLEWQYVDPVMCKKGGKRLREAILAGELRATLDLGENRTAHHISFSF